MIEEREAMVELSEENEINWRHALIDFKRDIFPMFADQGISLAEAFIIWKLNEIRNDIIELQDQDD